MIDVEARAAATQARELMAEFAEGTGLVGEGREPVRYLWTDAFAVCNFLSLGETELALRLVDQVHRTLGRRDPIHGDDGWLSGLDDTAAEKHPTWGGLRIGKRLPERDADESFDERLEWDRDGQYFHYLTKWMHALDQVARATGEPRFNVWARELAEVAFRAFTYVPAGESGGRRMHWKMSVDLSRPLVASMGRHDPLDGYITFRQLQGTAELLGVANVGPTLMVEAAELAAMIPDELATDDPLGIGGLLGDAWRVEQLARDGAISGPGLRDRLLEAALVGLRALGPGAFRGSADYRLAFRELGLAIGLAALPLLGDIAVGLSRFMSLRDEIDAFWLDPEQQRAAPWLDHRHINEVLLARSLVPDGFLTLRTA
ncbi:MAG TPA: hypothetical protein VGQ89_01805 [Candidatus Limnocylindrales bacterium]|nr:hypothetical protein [Candidatus Limnocylindrales bacterium]